MPILDEMLALDRGSMRRVDIDGHLHVARTPISKANVCPYYGREIPDHRELGLDADRIYHLYRDPAELAKGAASFSGKPLLDGHRPVTAEDHDHQRTVGSVTNAEFVAPYLYAALDIWAGTVIDAIESGRKEQLSCGYRYKPIMSPGVTLDGIRYDGLMTDIIGNHVAIVPEGRAGPDVMVADTALPNLEDLFMGKQALASLASATTRGALMTYLRPKLATDAKVDLNGALESLTRKNFKERVPGVVTGVQAAVKGKLAKDADIDDVQEVIEALAEVLPSEEEAAAAMDDDDEDLKKRLKEKGCEDAEIARICAGKTAADADEDDDEEEAKKKAAEKKKEAEDMKAAQDAAIAAATKGMVTKADLELAVKTAQDAAAKTQSDIREAERAVRPWVGDLAMSFDSAEAVYRKALETRGVPNVDKLHPDALLPILQVQPKPGEQSMSNRVVPIARDAAADAAFKQRFPNAGRLKK